MTADAATGLSALSPYEMLQFLNTLGWSIGMGASLLLWFVAERYLGRGCESCAHCAAKRDQADADARGDSARERLFGVQRVEGAPDEAEPSEEEPSGGPKCHAGCPCGNGWVEGDD